MTGFQNRSAFGAQDIVVGLDTCVLRELGYTEPGWLRAFTEMAAAGIRFSFLDNVPAEITLALQQERFTFEQLGRALRLADSFLFEAAPSLPGGIELRWAIGATDVAPIGGMSPFLHASALWTNFRKSRTLKDLETPILTGGPAPQEQFEMTVTGGSETAAMFEVARDEWISNIKRFDLLAPNSLIQARALRLQEERQRRDAGRVVPPPALSVRTDLSIQYRVRLDELRNLPEGQRMNPESKKRRNDAIDITMLDALMLPALLCLEPRLARAVRLLPSFQALWVYDPETLADAWSRGEVRRPSWPT